MTHESTYHVPFCTHTVTYSTAPNFSSISLVTSSVFTGRVFGRLVSLTVNAVGNRFFSLICVLHLTCRRMKSIENATLSKNMVKLSLNLHTK